MPVTILKLHMVTGNTCDDMSRDTRDRGAVKMDTNIGGKELCELVPSV